MAICKVCHEEFYLATSSYDPVDPCLCGEMIDINHPWYKISEGYIEWPGLRMSWYFFKLVMRYRTAKLCYWLGNKLIMGDKHRAL